MAIEPGRGLEPHEYIPGKAPLPLCGPLILHPSLKDTEIMDIVMAQQSFQSTNSGKRRVRRPFTVIEVAALVQAVELLGTGRYIGIFLVFVLTNVQDDHRVLYWLCLW